MTILAVNSAILKASYHVVVEESSERLMLRGYQSRHVAVREEEE